MRKIQIILCILAVMLLHGISVNAAPLNYIIDMEYSENLLTFEGKAEPNDYISIEVILADIDPTNFWNVISGNNSNKSVVYDTDKLIYADYIKADENGNFSLNMTITQEDTYKIFIYSTAEEKVYEQTFNFTDKDSYKRIIDILNGYVDQNNKTEFQNTLNIAKDHIGFDDPAFASVDFDKISGLIFDRLKEKNERLSNGNSNDNEDLYATAAFIVALNEGVNIDEISDRVKAMSVTDDKFDNFISQIFVVDESKNLFASLMKGKNLDFENIDRKAKEALILTTVRYPDGWGNIQQVFNAYGTSVLGLTSVTSDGSVYQKLAGKSYNDIPALTAAYKSFLDSNSGGGTGGGGAGGGGGTGGKDVSTGAVIAPPPTINPGVTETLTMPFEDLNSVPWAYSAISNLYTQRIISGVSEEKFMPDKNVKREEFATMLVQAMGLSVTGVGKQFKDVVAGSWYEGYVKTACSNNIVSGMPNNMFGVGYDISRQDMAVMVMNAMVSNGYFPSGSELKFEDADLVAGYAKTAVAELAKLGIVSGVDETHFAPTGVATRAQAAVIIDRALSYLK